MLNKVTNWLGYYHCN